MILKKTDKGTDLEIVFVSSDRDQSSFDDYFLEMPWLALPYSDRTTHAKLSKQFKIQGIPALVVLDPAGKVITTEGRAEVMQDPTGKKVSMDAQTILGLVRGCPYR